MKLREFYENNGIDYDAFIHRLRGKESLAVKYIRVFLTDSTFGELIDAVERKDLSQVGKTAHALKGIALNLDFIKLSDLCVEIIDTAKLAKIQEVERQFELLKTEFEQIVSALQSLAPDLGV